LSIMATESPIFDKAKVAVSPERPPPMTMQSKLSFLFMNLATFSST
jgi:hypothetical protein